jgi:hypothetical protein
LAIVPQRPCGYNPTSNPPCPFLFLPLFKESCDPLIRRLENTHAAVETAAVRTWSTQPTCGYPGGSRMTTGIGRSVRFW